MLWWSETMGFIRLLDANCFFPHRLLMVPVGLFLLNPRLAHGLLDLPLVLLEHVIHVGAGRHQRPRVMHPLVPPSETLAKREKEKKNVSKCD